MDASTLTRLWYRSPEDDDAERIVYRDRTHAFAPSRAPRPALDLQPDGVARYGTSGPADALEYIGGSWSLAGDILTLTLPGREEAFHVETVAGDRLVLRRVSEAEN